MSPLPQLTDKLELRKKLRQETKCHKCGEQCRYIHDDKVWCRSCLDCEQYPQFAHLTQQEREDLRAKAIENIKSRGFVNAGNLQPSVGFK
jgi:hypothetical protein